jgi:thioredoxin-related protein
MKMGWLISVIVLGNLLFLPSKAIPLETGTINWHRYSEEAFLFANETDKPIFMVIKAEWCHVCRLYEENVLNTEEITAILNENYVPILIDFDDDYDIAHEYAFATPTSVILSPQAELVASIPGYIEKKNLLLGLESSLVPLKNGQLDNVSENFHFNSHERMSFGNSNFNLAIPISRAESLNDMNMTPILGIILFILLSSVIARYKIFQGD